MGMRLTLAIATSQLLTSSTCDYANNSKAENSKAAWFWDSGDCGSLECEVVEIRVVTSRSLRAVFHKI